MRRLPSFCASAPHGASPAGAVRPGKNVLTVSAQPRTAGALMNPPGTGHQGRQPDRDPGNSHKI
jgi:hypothetical protein